ncbi:MAG: hypothetical protein ACOC35_09060 [Promethearchaeia archaeon]
MSSVSFSIKFTSNLNSQRVDTKNDAINREDSEELKNSLTVGNTSISDGGDPQGVKLSHLRNETFENKHTDNGELSFSNLNSGWNMSQFSLNFTELSAEEEYVDFQTRADSGEGFDQADIYYATSFQIPNTCLLRNISQFIQYWGGGDAKQDQRFSISIYNATDNGGNLIPNASLDSSNIFDLSNLNASQPVKWYQANFTDVTLNISNTENNTFFAVFQSIEYNIKPVKDSYFFYANKKPDDVYNSTLYTKSGNDAWSELEGKSGCLKVNLAPISPNPNPAQVNLTVLNQSVNSNGFFQYEELIPHSNDQFHLPISSLWFSDVTYNATFQGKFEYNTYSMTKYNTTVNQDVIWNASLSIAQFPDVTKTFSNNIEFTKPASWVYDSTYNGSKAYEDKYIEIDNSFIKIENSSNGFWSILCNQSNIIQDINLRKSSDNNTYSSLTHYANITDWINSSMGTSMTNGEGKLFISESSEPPLECNITEGLGSFPIWRPDRDTTVINNNSRLDLKFLATNGTMAGIAITSFHVLLSELNISLVANISSNILKNNEVSYKFNLTGRYNSEPIDTEAIQISYEKSEGNTITLVEDYHYLLRKEGNMYNITIDTSRSDFLAGPHGINFTFSPQYYEASYYEASLQIQKRVHNMSFVRTNKENRTYNLGDSARYYFYLNDSVTGATVLDAEFFLKANFTGASKTVSTSAYSVYDYGNGTYEITIFTEELYQDKELLNLTIEFYSEKEGIYSLQNVNESLNIINEPHNTSLTILSNSSTNVIIGKSLWVTLQFKDLNTGENLTDGNFEITNNSETLNPSYYEIDEANNRYEITFDLETLEIGTYNLYIEANKSREDMINYIRSATWFNFTFSAAKFDVTISPLPNDIDIYADDTSNSILVNISYALGQVENIQLTSYFSSNKLSIANEEPGLYKIFLDSQGCNIGTEYEFNLTISKEKFTTFTNKSFVNISAYPSKITIPDEYHNQKIYQEQTLEMIAILKDTFRETDILNAEIRMKIKEKTSYSEPFAYLASDFGWYTGSLQIGTIAPGKYDLIIEMNATKYQSAKETLNITILERKSASIKLEEELATHYVKGDTFLIRFKLLAGEEPIANAKVKFEINKYYENNEREREELYSTTNKNGEAKINYLLEEEDLASIEIKIEFSGSVQYKSCSLTGESIDIRSESEQMFLNTLPFIPFIIGAAIGISGYGLKRRHDYKKQMQKWQKQEQLYQEMMNIQYLLIINKESGNPILQDDFGDTELDGTLVSGFLQAITSFIYGIKKQKTDRKEKSHFLFDHQDYKILLEDGKYVRVALVLNQRPSELIKEGLREFINRFESHYEDKLKDFNGMLKHFRDYMKLSTTDFRLTLYMPHVINPKLVKTQLDEFEKTVLDITRTFEIMSEKHLNIPELRKYLISVLPKEPIERITYAILGLMDKNYLIPLFEGH